MARRPRRFSSRDHRGWHYSLFLHILVELLCRKLPFKHSHFNPAHILKTNFFIRINYQGISRIKDISIRIAGTLWIFLVPKAAPLDDIFSFFPPNILCYLRIFQNENFRKVKKSGNFFKYFNCHWSLLEQKTFMIEWSGEKWTIHCTEFWVPSSTYK